MNRKVSVVITSFNRGRLLERAVLSVLSQDYKNYEVIVVDDCSTDTLTQNVLVDLESLSSNIKVYKNRENRGANYCRNKGISMASGYYYTGLDDDDYFLSDRLTQLIGAYDDNFAFVSDNFLVFDGKNKRPNFSSQMRLVEEDLEYANLAGNQIFTTLDKIKSIACFDTNLKRLQDQDTWLRLLQKYEVGYRIDKCTYVMDISHELNRTTKNVKNIDTFLRFYSKHKNNMSVKNRVRNEIRLYKYGYGKFQVKFILSEPIIF